MGGWKKEGGGKPHEWHPSQKGFWTPPLVRYVFHPPQASALCFSCTKIHARADQKLFWRGPKIFGRARSLVRFPPPIRFAPPHITAQPKNMRTYPGSGFCNHPFTKPPFVKPRTLAKPCEVWRTLANPQRHTRTSLTCTRVPAKVPHIHRKRAEYGFGEYGFKHQTQWVFWGSLSSGERTQWVPLSLLFVCQSELTEFFLGELAQWVLVSETVLSKQYSATVSYKCVREKLPSGAFVPVHRTRPYWKDYT